MSIKVKNVSFSYDDNAYKQKVIFEDVNIEFKRGTFCVITGLSGSGKTTFLSLLNKLNQTCKGSIEFDNINIDNIKSSKHRKENVSTIYQSFNLIEFLNAYENVELALDLANIKIENKKEYINKLLKKVGLSDYEIILKVSSLSGGEQQRVAIARALAVKTKYILADEPTGNLDSSLTRKTIALLKKIALEENVGVIVVTHSDEVCNLADELYEINNHKLVKIEK